MAEIPVFLLILIKDRILNADFLNGHTLSAWKDRYNAILKKNNNLVVSAFYV